MNLSKHTNIELIDEFAAAAKAREVFEQKAREQDSLMFNYKRELLRRLPKPEKDKS